MQRTDLPDAILVMLSSSDRADDASARGARRVRGAAQAVVQSELLNAMLQVLVTRSGKKN